MAKRRRKRQRPRNRRHARRRQQFRRRGDYWRELGKLLGLVASMAGALLGQAELLGEPVRHYLTVTCIAATGGFGFLVGPDSLRLLKQHWSGGKAA